MGMTIDGDDGSMAVRSTLRLQQRPENSIPFVCCGLVERSVGFSTRHHWALRLYSGGRCASQKRKEKRESTYGHVRARIGMNFDPSSMSFVV
ncbi:hypothetical protein PAHAL_5G061800 [Panicum hallii]|uniref:Uncharacterized protein n=1 Tax=Panicum hallii TaxID=206008 RepID=A0A2T8IJ44_9POAL|nr:hypothetical protein PAHAL_5G061800 [Panicum hallii]